MSTFDDLSSGADPWGSASDGPGPPLPLALISVFAGSAGIALAVVMTGAAAWSGWASGFLGIVAAVGYRVVARSRGAARDYRPDYRVDRLMLLGLLLSFGGVVGSAWVIAQQVTA